MTNQELTYWVTLALMPKIWTRRKNEIYVKCFEHNPQISIIDLFENRYNCRTIHLWWKTCCRKVMIFCLFIVMNIHEY